MSKLDLLRELKLIENVPGMIYTFVLTGDNVMTFSFVSPQCREVFEFSSDEMEADPHILEKIIHPEEQSRLMECIFYSRAHLTQFEWDGRIITKSGKVKRAWVRSTPEKLGHGTIEWNGIVMDATDKFNRMQELEKINASLIETQLRLREIADNAPGIIFEWNKNKAGNERIQYIGSRVERDLAYKPTNINEFLDLLHPDDQEIGKTTIQSAIQNGHRWEFEGRLRDKFGNYRWWQGSAKIFDQTNLNPIFHGQLIDIDEKKSREESERMAQKKIETILQAIPDMIFIINSHGNYEEFYSRGEEDLVLPKEHLLGKNLGDVFSPSTVEQMMVVVEQVIGDGITRNLEYDLEVRGRTTWFEARIARYDEKRVLVLARNVSEKHLLLQNNLINQMRLVESSRLASLGEMAGGVAHEINNPLTVIIAHTEKLRVAMRGQNFKSAESVGNSLNKIESTAIRISKIVSGLRSISREGSRDALLSASIVALVDDAVSLCHEKAKHWQIELTVIHEEPLAKIQCKPVQISQVILNLLINSIQAVSTLKEKWIHLSTGTSDNHLEIRVMDSGTGIPEEIRKKIFDPFFTTKDVGMGTGLGLGISKAIIEDHKGSLVLEEGQKNTCFSIKIPLQKKR
jgi:signal transduction histidine kinase